MMMKTWNKYGNAKQQNPFTDNWYVHCITKTRLFKYIEKFTTQNWKFSNIKTLLFFIFLLKT